MTTPNNTISDADFAKTQTMARLTLTGQEKQQIHSQLDEALKAIEVFDELDLNNVPPLEHPGGLKNVLRDDVVTPSLTQEDALINAPASHKGFVMIPGVFEDES